MCQGGRPDFKASPPSLPPLHPSTHQQHATAMFRPDGHVLLTWPSTLSAPQPRRRFASTRMSVDLPQPGAPSSRVVRPCSMTVCGVQ